MQVIMGDKLVDLTVTPEQEMVEILYSVGLTNLALVDFSLRQLKKQLEESLNEKTNIILKTPITSVKLGQPDKEYYGSVALLQDITKLQKETQLAIETYPLDRKP